jgi:hypothetical protein
VKTQRQISEDLHRRRLSNLQVRIFALLEKNRTPNTNTDSQCIQLSFFVGTMPDCSLSGKAMAAAPLEAANSF